MLRLRTSPAAARTPQLVRRLLDMNLHSVLIDNAAVTTHSFVETEKYADLVCMHQAMSARQTKLCLTKQKLCSQNVQPLHDSYGAAH
jgi:hypothetical protein